MRERRLDATASLLALVLGCGDAGPGGTAGDGGAEAGTSAGTSGDEGDDTGGTNSGGVGSGPSEDDSGDTGSAEGSGDETGSVACSESPTPWSEGQAGPWVVSNDETGYRLPSGLMPATSDDGRVLAFVSLADPAGVFDEVFRVYVADLGCGTLEVVAAAGPVMPIHLAVSGDGSTVAFIRHAAADGGEGYVYDRNTGVVERYDVGLDGVPVAGFSQRVSVSGDGRFIAFDSDATGIVQDDTPMTPDVFVRDRETQSTERISEASDGTPFDATADWPSITSDGRYVAFSARGGPIDVNPLSFGYHVYLHDRQEHTTVPLTPQVDLEAGDASGWEPDLSGDGRFLAFTTELSFDPADDNELPDVYLLDRDDDSITWVSAEHGLPDQPPSGARRGQVSGEGRFVGYMVGYWGTLIDHAVYDRDAGTFVFVSDLDAAAVPGTLSEDLVISEDGRWAMFSSNRRGLTEPPIEVGSGFGNAVFSVGLGR